MHNMSTVYLNSIINKEEFEKYGLKLYLPDYNNEENIKRDGIDITLTLWSDCTYDGYVNNTYEIEEVITKLKEYFEVTKYDTLEYKGVFKITITDTILKASLLDIFEEEGTENYKETDYDIFFCVDRSRRKEFQKLIDVDEVTSICYNAKHKNMLPKENQFAVAIEVTDKSIFDEVDFGKGISITFHSRG